MTHTIRVEHRDGTTDTLGHIKSEIDESFGKMSQARLVTTRRDVDSVTLEETDDEVFLDDASGTTVFGGVLRDVDRESAKATLTVDSFERYALDAEPTPAGTRYQNVADTTIVDAAIAAIPQVTAGAVDSLASGLTFVFNHATRANQIRTVADTTGARVRYNVDKTVDYIDRHGTDRDELLSPETQTTVGRLHVTRKGSDGQRNKLRILGVGEGIHQRQATVTADGFDPATDREKWRVYKNKSITDTETLRQQGQELLSEMADAWIEVETTVRADALGTPIELGDTFPVRAERKGLDDRLQVVTLTRAIDSDGERVEVTLSSRIQTRETTEEKARADIERFNAAFEGTPVTINSSGGRQPVNINNGYFMRIYYPAEVKYEHRLNLRAIGQPYRAYSAGAASGGDHTHDVTHPSHSHGVNTTSEDNSDYTRNVQQTTSTASWSTTNSTDWFEIDRVSPSNPTSELWGYLQVQTNADRTPRVRLHNLTKGTQHPSNIGHELGIGGETGEFAEWMMVDPTDTNGETVALEMKSDNTTTEDYNGKVMWFGIGKHTHNVSDTTSAELGTTETSTASGPHSHSPDPGIIETFGGEKHYPSNVDVVINGNGHQTNWGDGTGPFDEALDIRGELNPGQINEINLPAESLGHLTAYVEGDVYRQVLGNG